MIRFLVLCLLFVMETQASVRFDVSWTSEFKKELVMTCEESSSLCQNVCGDSQSCIINEGACRDCIGTNLVMTNFITGVGRTIVNSGVVSSEDTLAYVLANGMFATFQANDVYNVIDGVNSIKAIKRFEKLCPEESSNQIVLLEVHPLTRKILRPAFVYCEMYEENLIFDLTDSPDVVILESHRIIF